MRARASDKGTMESPRGRLTSGHILVPALAALSMSPVVSSAVALVTGALLALAVGNPYLEQTRKLTPRLLSYGIVGLGAGMNLEIVARVGLQGLGYTAVSILSTLAVGLLLGRLLGVERVIAILISVGTAICGGSAIAAAAPVVRAKHHEVSVALGTVFLLNGAALMVFPTLGQRLGLSQEAFGLWSALAIHDTSSVVGASMQYGQQALQVGTTVKLARALWIVPVTLGLAYVEHRRGGASAGPAKKPWFILGFLVMAALFTYLPALGSVGQRIEMVAKRSLVLTLFLIGAGLTRATLQQVGVRPFLQGVILWAAVCVTTAGCIVVGWLR
jgi:uncharacterized integral membrane protein (TIGR00698 family)